MDTLNQIADYTRQIAAKNTELARLHAKRRELIAKAHKEGANMTKVIEITGLSRGMVYKHLGKVGFEPAYNLSSRAKALA
jgi:DNA-binding phage protein